MISTIFKVFAPIIFVILVVVGILAAIFRKTSVSVFHYGMSIYQTHPFLMGIYLTGAVITALVTGFFSILGGKNEGLIIPFIATPFWPVYAGWCLLKKD